MPTCIYCLQEKEKSEFNKEHVVARCFGTYEGAAVLSHFEVCRECNTYFNDTFESVINLDSIETVERMRFGRPMKDAVKQTKKRTKVQIVSGILEGLDVTPTVNNQTQERMFLAYSDFVGIRKMQDEVKYDFYQIDEIPIATADKRAFLKTHEYGIISFGYDQDEVLNALNRNGWEVEKKPPEEDELLNLIANEKTFKVTTTDVNDHIKRRFAAKNLFNFLCHQKGKEFVLNPRFNSIRDYIRYDVWDQSLYFSLTFSPDKTMELPNEHGHCLAYMWCPDDGNNWAFFGTVTWYGKMTYNFKLCDTSVLVTRLEKNILPSTQALYCDNEKRTQRVDKKGIYVFRKSSGHIILLFPYDIIIGPDVIQ